MKKRKWKWMRFRKNDPQHNLLCAAQKYIHANGGSAVVLGGISLMERGGVGRYSLLIDFLGRKIEKPTQQPEASDALAANSSATQQLQPGPVQKGAEGKP